jgi:glycosyltransferase involved in cell wall biosynthesis
MQPLVSIILPTFNRVDFLRDAVESVFAQTFRCWQLLIADDGSDDPETKAYLRALDGTPGVTVLWLAHTGNPPAVRNAALREAKAQYIAFLDSDDVWMPKKLELQIASLRSRAARQWSYTGFVMMDGARNPFTGARAMRCPAVEGSLLGPLLKRQAIIVQSSVVAARELIATAGGYDETLPICGDYELWLRLAPRTEADFIDEPLVHVRRHDQHYSDDVTALKDLQRALEKTRRSGAASGLDRVLRWRRAGASAALARSHAVSGNRARALGALFSSAHYSWRYGEWWRGALGAIAHSFLPVGVLAAVRRYRNSLASRRSKLLERIR